MSVLQATYVIVLVEVGLFDFLPLEGAAVGQDLDDGLLISPFTEIPKHA